MNVNAPYFPGRHLLADFYDCNAALLDDVDRLQTLLLEAAERIGATVVGVQFNHFNPIGVSGVVIIAESHLTIHTWPEIGFAAVDFFTCGEIDAGPGIAFLGETLEAKNVDNKVMMRGVGANVAYK